MASKREQPGSSNKETTPEDALAKLDKMAIMRDENGAIKRFLAYHHLHDGELSTINLEQARVILGELARSDQPIPSNHAFYKLCMKAVKEIEAWRGRHPNFNMAIAQNKMPWIPTSISLSALRYLDPKYAGFPPKVDAAFKKAKLSEFPAVGGRSNWWNNAALDNEKWRDDNLVAKSSKPPVPGFRVKELLRLTISRTIFARCRLVPPSLRRHHRPPPQTIPSSDAENEEDESKPKKRRKTGHPTPFNNFLGTEDEAASTDRQKFLNAIDRYQKASKKEDEALQRLADARQTAAAATKERNEAVSNALEVMVEMQLGADLRRRNLAVRVGDMEDASADGNGEGGSAY
ncbi:uncharacterized protein B0H64DRAFT_436008 [Chaetomium fimeti]|uniref:Uncharacterized protein n=1 Tax=Chaetomium fimeti TaxID=1854472 RepID=A0AAE0H6Z8_9PEZI|nr:hypothetical protein B0H64DRAFT_436008 [Chaetomium fimeti]